MMSEPKSKLPDFKEITLIAGKLFNDVKKSINEIIIDFKKKRAEEDKVAKPRAEASSKPKKTHGEVVVEKETIVVKAAKKPAPKKAKVKKDEAVKGK